MEYLPNFQVHRPRTAEEAVKLRAENTDARFLAGGTDMIVNVRRGIEQPSHLIDLTHIGELTEIREEADGTRVGAAITLQQLADYETVRHSYRPGAVSAKNIESPRNEVWRMPSGRRAWKLYLLPYQVPIVVGFLGERRLRDLGILDEHLKGAGGNTATAARSRPLA